MIAILPGLALDDGEISESFVRASGPDWQTVKKVLSAIPLRLHVRTSPSLPAPTKARPQRPAEHRHSSDGVHIITSMRFRAKERNSNDARQRPVALTRRAAT